MTEPAKSNWTTVVLSTLAGITAAAHIGKVPSALPLIRAELDLSIVQAGWVMSIIAAMAMATGMAAGMVGDRIGHRRLIIVGLLILAASGAAGSFAASGSLLLASRFFESVGFISVAVAATPLIINAILDRHRPVVLGVWGIWVPAGIALSMLVAALMLVPVGWRTLWLFWSAIAAGLAISFLAMRPSTPKPATAGLARHFFTNSLRLIMSHPGPILLALNFALYTAQWTSMMMWLPSFLVEQRGLPVSSAALLGGLVVAINVPGNLCSSWLLHRGFERIHMIGSAHLLMGLCAVGIFSGAVPDEGRYALALVFSFFSGLAPSAMFASIPVHAPSPQQLGATSGLILQGSNVGNFFGPPAVAGIVAAMGTWNDVMWMMVGCAASGVALAFWIKRIESRTAKSVSGD